VRLSEGNVAVITGGSSGIGYAIAQELVGRKLKVVLLARRESILQEAKRKLGGEDVEIVPVDVSSLDAVKKAKEKISGKFKKIDLLVNCAGIVKPALLQDLPEDDVTMHIQVNLLGTMYVTKAFLNSMAEGGAVISISSINGIFGIAGYSPYAASKFGIVGFSDSLRRELFKRKISIHVAFPPDTDTPQYKEESEHMPEWMSGWVRSNPLQPEVVAKRILKAASRGRFIILPGMSSKFYAFMMHHLPLLSRFLIDKIAPKP
jgi:3-dehydrosphinganine reductase